MTLRISCWSGPRNVSSALMRSFAQRSDTRVVDEPLYGHYLVTTGAPHPALEELVAVLETDGERAVRETVLGPCDRDVLFLKQMAHHLTPDLDTSFLGACVNLLLVRDPEEVITTLVKQLPRPTLRDLGIARQAQLLHDLRAIGQEPPVLDARELLLDPAGVLAQLCDRIGIPWDDRMLSWPGGPHPADGPWAPYWYDNLHRSTGFAPYRPKPEPVPDACRPLLEECRPLYEELAALAIPARR